jgi:hypothetical protein
MPFFSLDCEWRQTFLQKDDAMSVGASNRQLNMVRFDEKRAMHITKS